MNKLNKIKKKIKKKFVKEQNCKYTALKKICLNIHL